MSDKLTDQESKWYDDQIEQIIGYDSGKWDARYETKKQWTLRQCKRLSDIGAAPETTFRLIMERIRVVEMEISEGYVRSLIRKETRRSIPRMALYNYISYIDYDKLRQAYTEYIESGRYHQKLFKEQRKQKQEKELIGR